MSKGAMESGEATDLGDDLQSRIDAIDVLKNEPTVLGEAIEIFDKTVWCIYPQIETDYTASDIKPIH